MLSAAVQANAFASGDVLGRTRAFLGTFRLSVWEV
jgi:hypothetical protein